MAAPRVTAVLLLVGLAPACRGEPPGPPTMARSGHAAPVDWSRAGREAAEVLSGYLRIDTRNPEGHEEAAARHLAALLQKEGISSELVPLAPGRANLIARLRSSGEAGPLCLLSHLDVVGADAAEWPTATGPWSGAIEGGYVWGRGALDMKGMGAIELLTLVWLKRLGVPLKRDVILLAVADEELGNQGMKQLAEARWGDLGCAHVLNEGGLPIEGLFFPGQTVFPISVAEKGVLWVKLTVRGEPGHGSTPRPDQAPGRLAAILARIKARTAPLRIGAATATLLGRIGRARGGLEGFALARPGLAARLLGGRIRANPLATAGLTDTISITAIDAPSPSPNVVADRASAILDCRLLPETRPADLLAELGRLADDPGARFEVLAEEPTLESPWADDPVYQALELEARREWPDLVIGPALSVGFSDSLYARRAGARAYGFVPFRVSPAEAATMHGRGERVSLENLERGLRVLLEAVLRVAAR